MQFLHILTWLSKSKTARSMVEFCFFILSTDSRHFGLLSARGFTAVRRRKTGNGAIRLLQGKR